MLKACNKTSNPLTMLTDVVESGVAVGISPQPALAAVEPGAALAAARGAPEGHRDVVAVHPLPVVGVLRVADCAHPVLTAAVASADERYGQIEEDRWE